MSTESGFATVDEITAEEFFSKFYATMLPVRMRNFFRHCPAVLEWSLPHLAARFGDADVEVMTNLQIHPNYAAERNLYARNMTFRALIDAIERNPESGDLYLVAQSRAFTCSRLGELADEVRLDPQMFNRERQRERTSLWIGPANTVTPLHHDLMSVVLAQVWGRKRLLLIAPAETARLYNSVGGYSDVDPEKPNLDRFPLFRDVTISVVLLEAGDAIFLPRGWWHHVRSLSQSISLSISNFVWPND